MSSLKDIKSVSGNFIPPGVIMPFAAAVSPVGWLICDGAAISRTTYANLFSAIRTTWGIGDDSASFVLPDFRGKFIRGRSAASTNDPDKLARTAQTASTFTRASCVTTNLQAYVTLASTTGISVGMSITGSNIPANTFIGSIDSATQFSMVQQDGSTAQNATGSGTVTLTFSQSALGNFVGSVQGHQVTSHGHGIRIDSQFSGQTRNSIGFGDASGNGQGPIYSTMHVLAREGIDGGTATQSNPHPAATAWNADAAGGNETRSINANVNYIIKY